MLDESAWSLIAVAVATLAQAYYMEPWKFNVMAWLWDLWAKITGYTANILGRWSVIARHNYMVTVNSGI